MNFSAVFIQRPVMTTLLMISILLFGIAAYRKLPISNMPDIAYPNINVTVGFPGGSPETMANNVATPLEKEFLTISGLVTATSSSTLGNTSIILQFDINKNIDAAAQDVQAAISRALPNLPQDLPNAPIYKKVNPALVPIFILALASDTAPLGELFDYANTFIGQRIAIIEGVAEVITYGSPFAVRVQVDPGKLATTGVTLQDVSLTLQAGNPYLPTGQLDGPIQSSTIIANGQLPKAALYDPLIVSYVNNSPLRIQDLGKSIDSLQNYRMEMKYIDHNVEMPAVALAILPQPGSNAVMISEEIHKILPSLMAQIPPSISLKILNDKSEPVRESILDVQFTLLIAFLLVVLVIFIYLGSFRNTIIPVLVLPMSVIGTFAVMHLLHFSLDNLSLLALILAIGFIIDDAIVVIENVVRFVEEGKSPWEAALEGSKQIGFTIVSMSLSLIAVFIPLLFMPGLLGKILAEFAITLTVITILSGFISLTLTPMLCRLFIRQDNHDKAHGVLSIGHRLNERMRLLYAPALTWILKHRLIALLMMFASLFISLRLLMILPKDFIPNDDIGFFIGYTQSAEGTSSRKMAQLQREVIEVVKKEQSIDQFFSVVANQQFRNGILYCHLRPRSERPAAIDVIKQLQAKTSEIVGINVFYKNIPMIDMSVGAQVKGAYQYSIQGFHAKDLYPAAQKFIEGMRKIPGIQGLNSDLEITSPQLFVDILRDQASSFGIDAFNIENALKLAYAGGRVSRIQTPINQYDVILELLPQFQADASVLNTIYVKSPQEQELVPLSAVSSWKEGVGPSSINHINQLPAVTLSFNLAPDMTLGEVLTHLDQLALITFPPGITGSVVGAAQVFQQSILSSAFLLVITVIAIYIVLGILYESYIHPITILTTLPPAILGGLLTLYLFNLPLSLFSFLGIILLIGIVKKNGIMMVDFALENIRMKGESAEKSIYTASMVRFRPIMMTTLTAIVGALPIALGIGAGAEARRPLGMVIIGGLLVSQLITLFITPVIYLYMEQWREKMKIQ